MVNVLFLGVLLSCQYFPQVESPKLPARTDLPYVESQQENEECFYDEDEPNPDGITCPAGYYKEADESFSPCEPCPFDENIRTYQPKENRCPTCILCTNCSELGRVVEEDCTHFNDTVCGEAIGQSFAVPTPDDVSNDLSPSSTLIDDTPSTTRPTIKPSSSPPRDDNSLHHKQLWMLLVIIPVFFTIGLVGCYCRLTHKRGGESGDAQDGSGQSGGASGDAQDGSGQSGGASGDAQDGSGQSGLASGDAQDGSGQSGFSVCFCCPKRESQLEERVRQLEEELRRIRNEQNGSNHVGEGENDFENGPQSATPLLHNGQNGNNHVDEGENETTV